MLSVRSKIATVVIVAGLLAGLYLISRQNYLLFHTIVEFFGIIIACCIFIIAWNTRRIVQSGYFMVLGFAYLSVGMIDFIHTLTYQGMGVFEAVTTNIPTQLWIAARYLESVSLLVAPLFLVRRTSVGGVAATYTVATLGLLGGILWWRWFPACYVEGEGLTLFKVVSEYAISCVLLGSIGVLLQKREHFDPGVLRLLVTSVALTIASELAFTLYVHAYGLPNLIGHGLKVLSFFLIYKAIVETGLRQPFDVLFRDLKRREQELIEYRDHLEERVRERTQELGVAIEQLRHEIEERESAEQALRSSQSALQESREEYRSLARKLLSDQEELSRRLARELHDDFSQRLAVLAIQAASVEQQLPAVSAPVAERMQRLRQGVTSLSSDLHAVARQLHPSILDDLGLADAVASACNAVSQHEGLSIAYETRNVPRELAKETELCIYRIAQEGLNNIVKHARAGSVHIALTGDDDELVLTIRDDGVGFDLGHGAKSAGIGLASMRERATLIRGKLVIDTAPGRGTEITVTVPVLPQTETPNPGSRR